MPLLQKLNPWPEFCRKCTWGAQVLGTVRCTTPDDASSMLLAMLRQLWGMATVHANAQFVIGRLDLVGGLGTAMALRADLGRRRAMWRLGDCAGEHAGWGARGHH